MQLGFVSAILPELSLEELLAFSSEEGFECVELMCWPPGQAERRYAGVTHLDADSCTSESVRHLEHLNSIHEVTISALGYYPNFLDPDPAHREHVRDHLLKVIRAAHRMGLKTVTTFLGRDPTRSVEDNWPMVRQVWPGIIDVAEKAGITIAIENCPMLFSEDEWPGGTNLFASPAIWRRFFSEFPSPNVGINFDPSHLIWLHIDAVRCIREFADKIVHVHAKDTRIDEDRLYEVGITGLGWQTPKIPGLGAVDWRPFFSALTEVGYNGPVCIEVEDRAFEETLDDRKRALRQSKRYLEQFVT